MLTVLLLLNLILATDLCRCMPISDWRSQTMLQQCLPWSWQVCRWLCTARGAASCNRQGCFPRRLWHSRPPCTALRAVHQEDPSLSQPCALGVCCAVVLFCPCRRPPLNALEDVFLGQSSSACNRLGWGSGVAYVQQTSLDNYQSNQL